MEEQASHRLLNYGIKARTALVAVMRKMLIVAYRLLKTEEMYNPKKVCALSTAHTPSLGQLATVKA